MKFGDVLYQSSGRVARITLNRPAQFNAITLTLPDELARAIEQADQDPSIHVIILTGAGKGFCGGYDLTLYAETKGENPAIQDMPWDPMIDYQFMGRCNQKFMSIWRCSKPVIARVHGDAIAGGSDIALCSDIIIMNETARIGYPPARVWGCPTTAMWIYRLGIEQAKKLLFTGELITGRQAEQYGLITQSVPLVELDDTVQALIERIAGVPKNQLMMMKMLVNQAYEQMGMGHTQMLATLFDGIARHSPEGLHFKQRAEEAGFKQAVFERDSGKPILGSKQ